VGEPAVSVDVVSLTTMQISSDYLLSKSYHRCSYT